MKLAATILVGWLLAGGCVSQCQQTASPVPIHFSYAGYEAGKAVPVVKAAVAVRPSGQDDTALLQDAIDYVGSLPRRPDGFRGAILLRPGRFHILGALHIEASGVVLRGSGVGKERTTLVAEGTGRRPLLQIGGHTSDSLGQPVEITDETVPTGARSFSIAPGSALTAGDHVVVRRPSTPEWIRSLGMTGLPGTFANARLDWAPGSHDLLWDRVAEAYEPITGHVQVDAPITTALEKKFGGGTVATVVSKFSVDHVGIEHLVLESASDPQFPVDEEHAWIAIWINNAEDAWVSDVAARHFVSSAVYVGLRARRVTV